MATADEQVIVGGQRAIAVQQQEGSFIYDGGATDIQAVVATNNGAQRAIKVVVIGEDGNPMSVDDSLSPTSTNPVQNKVITGAINDNTTAIEQNAAAIEELGEQIGSDVYSWQKPTDWVDIRSGALGNSIYLLVAHSEPTVSEGVYTIDTYPQFIFNCQVSTPANTYDVFVDGVKVATGTSSESTTTTLDWGTLYAAGTVSTVYTTTHPSSLVYHIVRIAPTVSTDTLVQFRNNPDSGHTQQGILWAHYQLSNAIAIYSAFGGESRPRNALLEAVTAKNNKLIYTVSSTSSKSGFYQAFAYCSSLVQLPILEAQNTTYAAGSYISFRDVKAKKVVIKNNNGDETLGMLNNSNIQELEVENGVRLASSTRAATSASYARKLTHLPTVNQQLAEELVMYRTDSLQDTVIDDSLNSARKILQIYGSSTYKTLGLKGLTVSSSAPFDGDSPQINVSYTGLNRGALVTLFKSLPTVTDSQVINITGATGAADLDATDLAIASGKGWTVIR